MRRESPPHGQGKRINRNLFFPRSPPMHVFPREGLQSLGGLPSHGIPGGALWKPPLKSRSREGQRGAPLSPPRDRPKGSPGSSGEGSQAFEPLSDPKGRPSSGAPTVPKSGGIRKIPVDLSQGRQGFKGADAAQPGRGKTSAAGQRRPPPHPQGLTRFVSCVSIMKLCTCFSALVSSSFRATTATTSAVHPAP